MKAYLVVDIRVHDPQRYGDYIPNVPALIEKHGARYVVRGGAVDVKDGDWHPDRLVVLEFPSKKAANSFIEDPEYAPIAAIRQEAASTNMVLSEGVPD